MTRHAGPGEVPRERGPTSAQEDVIPNRTTLDDRVDEIEVRAYTVPTDEPEADGTLAWDSTTIVVVLARSGDRTGVGYTYGPAACAGLVRDVLAGVARATPVLDVRRTWEAMVRAVRNAGRPGVASLAISAVDLALWDLEARVLDLPLHGLLGAVHDEVRVYGSGGFTTYTDERMARQLEGWRSDGIELLKIKIGEDAGRRTDRDRHRVRLARRVIGPEADLFVDANGGYGAHQAVRFIDSVADAGVVWFEEPVTSDDLAGLSYVRDRVAPDVTAGEYGFDLEYFRRMCAAGAVDCLQVDVTRCGGITGWHEATAVARAHRLEVSAHTAPQVSLAVCAATPGLRHLEWFHDHVRVEEMLFDGCVRPVAGTLRPGDAAGNGLTLKTKEADRYRVA